MRAAGLRYDWLASALNRRIVQDLSHPARCEICPKSMGGPIALVVGFALAALAVVAAYVVVIVRSPGALRRWVSTLTILVNHALTVGIIGSLQLSWPVSVQHIIAFLGLNMLHLPQASCLANGRSQEGLGLFGTYAIVYCSIVNAVLLSLPLLLPLIDPYYLFPIQ